MRRCLVIFLLSFLAACNPSAEEPAGPQAPPQLSYSVTMDRSRPEPTLVIDMRFTGDGDGVTLLRLPSDWASESELYNALSEVEAQSDGAVIAPTDDPAVFEVTHVPGEEVHLTYRLTQDWEGVPEPGAGNPYRAIIQPDYVHLIGWAAWALPGWDDWPGESPEVDLTLDVAGLPADWTVADNFGAGSAPREGRVSLSRLQGGLFVAGDFRLLTRTTGAAPLNIAIRGSWPFGDNELADELAEVVRALRTFWREQGTEPYLVTLIPLHRGVENEGAVSWGGTGLSDSFALFATTNVDLESFRGLAAHEFQHRWTPALLGEFADPEEALYWFSEGFTEYYASLLLLRGELIDLQGYADQINGALREYYRSPVREAPVEQVVEWFWSNPDLQRLPYLRGRLIAARWNAAIAQASGGAADLDDVLFDLLEAGAAAREAGAPRELASRDIVAAAAARGAAGAEEDHRRFVVEGATVPIEPGLFGPCLEVRDTAFALWDLGFDAEASFEARTVTGVREGGPAWDAGLRDGMPFGGWSIPDYGDPETDATFFVGIEGEAVPITYKPQGEESETIPQIFLTDGLSGDAREACRVWLGAD